MHVALLTAGHDKPYVVPLAVALADAGVMVDFVGSDALLCDQVAGRDGIRFLNLRGEQSTSAPLAIKMRRLGTYYLRLLRYAASAKVDLLHIIWNNKFEWFDRTLLMLWYRLFGKRVLLTAHNINAAKRDGRDSAWNRLTLRIQYRLCDHVFVHTQAMKQELCEDYGMGQARVTVIPFGMNDTIPSTTLTRQEARRMLGLDDAHRVLLFFGMIVPYKGLEDLVAALGAVAPGDPALRLLVAGPVKRGSEQYWRSVHDAIHAAGLEGKVLARIEFVPDAEVERYFKAADAVVLSYRDVFQSGVPFLAFNFGLPVIATDVGALREDVIEGLTGVLCAPRDPHALADAIRRYFKSELYRELDTRRDTIRAIAREGHSWQTVAKQTVDAYVRVRSPDPMAMEARTS